MLTGPKKAKRILEKDLLFLRMMESDIIAKSDALM